jgi:hypothetical protein
LLKINHLTTLILIKQAQENEKHANEKLSEARKAVSSIKIIL